MTEDNAGPLQGSPATDRLRAVGRRRQEAEGKLEQFQQQSHEKAAAEDAGREDTGQDTASENGDSPTGGAETSEDA